MTPAAARQRRWRARARAGARCVILEIDSEILDALTDSGRLGTWDESDAKAVGEVVQRLVRDWATVTRLRSDISRTAMHSPKPETARPAPSQGRHEGAVLQGQNGQRRLDVGTAEDAHPPERE
jgi:hypothetical protein